jgi:hypothetical protein
MCKLSGYPTATQALERFIPQVRNRVSCVLEGDEVCVTDLIDVLPFFQLAMPLHDAQPVREKTPAVRPSADLVCSYCEVMVYV